MAFAISLLVAGILVFSGLSWLRPSKDEYRRMETRQASRKLGLHPQIKGLNEWAKARSPKTAHPYYAMAQTVDPTFSIWWTGQEWIGQPQPPQSNRCLIQLNDWLGECPSQIIGVDATATQIGVWWPDEIESELNELKSWMLRCPLIITNPEAAA